MVSSSGGQAVTDSNGRYRLEVQMPLDAESVQVTATSSSSGSDQVASTRVDLSPASGSAWVDSLTLTEGTGKTTSAGCVPFLSHSGTASSSATSTR